MHAFPTNKMSINFNESVVISYYCFNHKVTLTELKCALL